MPGRFSEPIRREQREVEALIRDVFLGVSREGGVSWSESKVRDGYGDPDECAKARAMDTEHCWEDLVDDPQWRHHTGVGGFNFLDPIGWRYYIAPAMVRCTRGERSDGILSFTLAIARRELNQAMNILPGEARIIARFIRLMMEMERESASGNSASWLDALAAWREFE